MDFDKGRWMLRLDDTLAEWGLAILLWEIADGDFSEAARCEGLLLQLEAVSGRRFFCTGEARWITDKYGLFELTEFAPNAILPVSYAYKADFFDTRLSQFFFWSTS